MSIDPDSGASEYAELAQRKLRGRHIPERPIVQITRNQNKLDALIDGKTRETFERTPGRSADGLREYGVTSGQAVERAVGMNVGGVEE